jgi:hypothetical protein
MGGDTEIGGFRFHLTDLIMVVVKVLRGKKWMWILPLDDSSYHGDASGRPITPVVGG